MSIKIGQLTGPMTEAQLSFITKLVQEKIADPAARCEKLLYAAGCDKPGASLLIDELKALSTLAGTTTTAPGYVAPLGHYKLSNGWVLKLKKAKYTDTVYVYVNDSYKGTTASPAGHAWLAEVDTQEKAYAAVLAYSAATSKCGVCNTKLTDPKSIAAGIGPVCAKKYGKVI